jgi:hypothetical protein
MEEELILVVKRYLKYRHQVRRYRRLNCRRMVDYWSFKLECLEGKYGEDFLKEKRKECIGTITKRICSA